MATVNELYIFTCSHLKAAVRRKCPENWRTNSCFLLHDTAPARQSVSVKLFLARNNVTTLQHHPYSPDMAAADSHLFPWLKSALMGQHFCAATYIIKNPTEELICFYKWLPGMFPTHLLCWQKCIIAQGIILKECTFNDCNILYLSKIKWFREHFEATMYIDIDTHACVCVRGRVAKLL
jgi:hypothetical protein